MTQLLKKQKHPTEELKESKKLKQKGDCIIQDMNENKNEKKKKKKKKKKKEKKSRREK
jgi:hypothetical protein